MRIQELERAKKMYLENMVGKKVWVIDRDAHKDGGYFAYVNKVIDGETVLVRGLVNSGEVSIWNIRSYEDMDKETTDRLYPSIR